MLGGVRDDVDVILEQWAEARPDLDVSPMAIIGRISRLSRMIDQELKRTFAMHGLDAPSFDVLATLRRALPDHSLSPGDLMQTAMVTSGAITQRLDKLEARGLVTRAPSAVDGRGSRVTLTPAGRRLIDRALPDHLATEHRIVEGLTSRQRAILINALQGMTSELNAGIGQRQARR
ncbi:MAG: hypothetical protein QOK10_3081 [Pseudonocardiales bacterium]|jgi:DNA-binding MarR family transcriptional regulator|nr:hypothetical protein [Pseudonocardiales bacterium]